MRTYKPIEIARELGISTSALRHYEAWGVVPAPERAANGYRLYTAIHLAYFRCLRALFAGFGVSVACEALLHVRKGETDAAFWLINREQARLQHEKAVADQTLALLQDPELPLAGNLRAKSRMTIGEAACGKQPGSGRTKKTRLCDRRRAGLPGEQVYSQGWR
jgi:DNA-binding transcriptional MerR regulator